MARGWIHTVHQGGRWENEVESEGPVSFHPTKERAVEHGRQLAIAARTEHVIHNMDGTISERNSYGNDPASSPG